MLGEFESVLTLSSVYKFPCTCTGQWASSLSGRAQYILRVEMTRIRGPIYG
jgi:hypothetical protein